MSNDVQHTRAIQMSLQTAEVQIHGANHLEELNLSFSLMSIARGNCNIQVKPVNDGFVGSVGWLKISIDRPIMNGEIFLQKNNFDKLINYFRGPFPRPITSVIILDQELVISSVGDLLLSEEKSLKIVDVSWIMPLT
ncbi:MAG: hypothetical protein P8M50_02735 [Paracoccaceae bacterium]|nr:hypothetical protein [Paracoccaceae bacterium]